MIDASTIPIVRHYGKERLAVGKNLKFASFLKRAKRVSSHIRPTKRVRIPPISQAVITVQTEQEGLVLVSSRTPTGKRMECNAVR